MYEALAKLVQADGGTLLDSSVTAAKQEVVITPASNLECETCREEYCEELGEKLLRFAKMKEMYDLFDPKSPTVSLEFDGPTLPANEKDHFAYVVSRSFASNYRKVFASLLKTISEADSVIDVGTRGLTSDGNIECIAEGLDALSLASIDSDNCTVGPLNCQDALDVQVNSCLMCKSGVSRLVPFVIAPPD